MNLFLWLLGGELLLALGGCILLWAIGGWRRRRTRDEGVAELLNELENRAPDRCDHYCRWLREHCGMDEEQALLAANRWLEEEKGFWRAWVAWQLQPTPSILKEFPSRLYRCIDTFLETLAECPVTPKVEEEEIVVTTAEENEEPILENDSGGDDGPMILSDQKPAAEESSALETGEAEDSRP